jgi:hypothetical protein
MDLADWNILAILRRIAIISFFVCENKSEDDILSNVYLITLTYYCCRAITSL